MAKFIPLKADDDIKYKNTWNPLNTISEKQLQMMIDNSRSGRISQIQLLYDLVESNNSTLAMCISRRQSALPDWTIKKRSIKKYRNFDDALANEQETFLTEQFSMAEDGGTLLPALRHLQMAVFRGMSVVQPLYNQNGLDIINVLDSWNFAIDYSHHNNLGEYPVYWNPKGSDILDFKNELQLIPENEIIVNFAKAPIDNFGLQIFLAQTLGMESYLKLISRKGLPATYIICPEDLPPENLNEWARKAVECTKGGSGAFPFGSQVVTQNIDSGNAQAIQNFLEYMEKQIIRTATGGTLASLTEATGLGSNVADIQNDVFKSIVKADATKIGDLINRNIAKTLLNMAFPGKPHLVYFDLEDEQKSDPEKYLHDAVLAKNAGLEIDINQLSENTGYKLTKTVETQQTSIWNVPNSIDKTDDKKDWEDEKVIVENTETPEEEVAEEKIDNPDEEEIKTGANLLKSFDKILMPIKQLFAKLFKAKDKSEIDEISKQIEDEIDKIENADDNEFVKAMEQLYKQGFEEKTEEE